MRELLGTKCTPLMRQAGYTVKWVLDSPVRVGMRPVPRQCDVSSADLLQAKQLLRAFDVMGTTEMYAEFLLKLSDTVRRTIEGSVWTV